MAKKYIKEEIINTARRLFNEHGYAGVSMRDIAAALGISVGNLTYHYRRKEELLLAVMAEIRRYQQPPIAPASLPQLNAMFAMLHNNIQQNAFYYWHYTQLSQLSPEVLEQQQQMVAEPYLLLENAFDTLQKAGSFLPPAYPGHYRQLAQALQMVCIYWTPQSRLEENLEEAPKDFVGCLWSILLPMLTEQGKEEYQEKVQKVRIAFE